MAFERQTISVVAGVVYDGQGRVLVNQRTQPIEFAGKWEFPGGKVEPGETMEQALRREMLEEVNIQVQRAQPLISIAHDYTHQAVRLHVYRVSHFTGVPRGNEGQTIKWVHPDALPGIDFLSANESILNAVRLPHAYLITDAGRFGTAYTLTRLRELLPQIRCVVQMREKEMDLETFKRFGNELLELCRRYDAPVLANADPEFAHGLGFDGVHLSSTRMKRLNARPEYAGFWVGASCHGRSEIEMAQGLRADYVALSPVCQTRSHEHTPPMGWGAFHDLCSTARIPVYALGGLGFDDIRMARDFGAQGVAMISGAWLPDGKAAPAEDN